MRINGLGFLVLASALLGGCAATPPVKEVLADPGAHLVQFAKVSPDILAKLPKGEPPLAFKRMEVDFKPTEVHTDKKAGTRDVAVKRVLTQVGNGVVASHDTVTNNGVPFRINYRVSYRGIVPLKWQNVFLNRAVADRAYELKTIKQFESVTAGKDRAEYSFEYAPEPQLVSFLQGREVCTIGAPKPATALAPALAGTMVEIMCENFGNNGQSVSKSTYAYLTQYGVALLSSFTDSEARTTNQITAVRVE